MPIDPRSYFINVPQSQGPMDMYRDYMSLRDLMDQRRYRDMQERRLQMQLDESQREQEEKERYRQGLMTLPASPTLQQAVQHLGPKGIDYWKAQQEALEKGFAREGKALEVQGKRGDIQKAVNEQIAGLGMQAYKITDPVEREQFFNTGVASALIDAGITPAEQFGGYRVPANRKEAEFSFGSLTSPDKLQAYLKAESEAQSNALKFSGEQIQHFGHLLGQVRDQPSYAAALKAAPPEIAALLPPMFSPAALQQARAMTMTGQQQAQEARQTLPNNPDELILWMNQPGRTPEELIQGKAALDQMTKYHQDIRPQVMADTGGLISAVVQNPGLWDQLSAEAKAKLAPGLAQAGFTNFAKPNAELQKQQTALSNFEKAVAAYRNELATTDPSVLPGKIPKLKALYTDMSLQAKEAANLGALTGPDMQLLSGLFTDPTSFSGAWLQGKPGLNDQLDMADAMIKRRRESLAEVYPAARGAAGAGSPKPSDIPNPLLNSNQPAKPQPQAAGPTVPVPPVGAIRRDAQGRNRRFRGGDPTKEENWPLTAPAK